MPDKNDSRSSAPRNAGRSRNAFEQLKALLSRNGPKRAVEMTEDHILSILIVRRGRETAFGPNLFSDPAWDLLLELYAAKLGDRRMSLADLATTMTLPESTTARWIAVLADRGLVASESDSIAAGRLWIGLTAEGESKLKRLADQWGAAFLSI